MILSAWPKSSNGANAKERDKFMKGKGYRSNVAKAVWIVIVHLAAVAAVICAAFFLMIYQTGIRLDDR